MKKTTIIILTSIAIIAIGGMSIYIYSKKASKILVTNKQNLSVATINSKQVNENKPKITVDAFKSTNPNSKFNPIRAKIGQVILRNIASYASYNQQVETMHTLVKELSDISDSTLDKYSNNGELNTIINLSGHTETKDNVKKHIVSTPITLMGSHGYLAFQFIKAAPFKPVTSVEIASIHSDVNWNDYGDNNYNKFKTKIYKTVLADLKNQNINLTVKMNNEIKKAIGTLSDSQITYLTGVTNENDMLVTATSKTDPEANYGMVIDNIFIHLILSYN